MKTKWQWWLLDIICFLLVILSFHRKVDIPASPANSTAPETKSSDIINVSGPTNGRENLVQGLAPVKNPAVTSIAETNEANLNHSGKFSAAKTDKNVNLNLHTAPPARITEASLVFEELRSSLSQDDLRTALYSAGNLLSDPSRKQKALPYYAMGRTLFNTGNIPAAIRLFEKALATDDNDSEQRIFRCSTFIFLTLSYYKIGNIEKAQKCFNEANQNATLPNHIASLAKIKNMLGEEKHQ